MAWTSRERAPTDLLSRTGVRPYFREIAEIIRQLILDIFLFLFRPGVGKWLGYPNSQSAPTMATKRQTRRILQWNAHLSGEGPRTEEAAGGQVAGEDMLSVAPSLHLPLQKTKK